MQKSCFLNIAQKHFDVIWIFGPKWTPSMTTDDFMQKNPQVTSLILKIFNKNVTFGVFGCKSCWLEHPDFEFDVIY